MAYRPAREHETSYIADTRFGELEAIYAGAPIGIAVLDRNLRFLRVNEVVARINEIPVEAHIGKHLVELFPDSAALVGPRLRRVVETGEPFIDLEVRASAPGNRAVEKIGRETALPVRGPDGEVEAIVVLISDVTDRVHAEEARRHVEAQLDLALKAADMGILEHGRDWSTMVFDDRLCDLFELPRGTVGEPLEAAIRERMEPDDLLRIASRCADVTASGGLVNEEFSVHLPEGGTRWFYVRARNEAEGREAEPRLIGVVHDITERKEREEALVAASASKSLLLDELEHRVKNILQMVTSLLNLQSARTRNEETREALNDAASRVVAIAAAYRRLARAEISGLVELEPMLAEIVAGVRTGVGAPESIRQDVRLASALVPGSTALHVGLLVNELLTNAYKHAFVGRAGGTIRLSSKVEDGVLVIEMSDDGVGMPSALGNGLGRMLTRAIAETIQARLVPLDMAEGTGHRIEVPLPAPT